MSQGVLGWLFLSAVTATPTPQALPTPTSVTARPVLSAPQAAAALLENARERADAELSVLDGGPLSQALRSSAARGLRLRVLLDPGRLSTRQAGMALGRKPNVEVRWLSGSGRTRVVQADGARSKAWKRGGVAAKLPQDWAGRFEARFAAAEPAVSELQRLEDELKALPDPTEGEPRIIERRAHSGE